MKGLEKITVLDFSKLMPGPYCTMLLADLGCRVIRIELPHFSDTLRGHEPRIEGQGFIYWMLNRNKESLCLDFRKPDGQRALLRLIAGADVLIEGFRPGLMDRLGLGAKALRRRFPRLIYCSLTGYGQSGPMSARAGHDINFLARAGYLGAGDSNGGVSFPATQAGDLCGSMYASQAILACLLDRTLSGRGRHIDVSMADAAGSWMVLPRGYATATGKDFRPGERWWSGTHPFYRLYRTKDRRYLSVGALERPFAQALLRVIGREDLEEVSRRDDRKSVSRTIAELEKTFSSRTLAAWERLLADKDVCVAGVRSTAEAMRDSRPPVLYSGSPRPKSNKPPRLGADNRAVLRSFGMAAAEIVSLKKAGLLFSACGPKKPARPRSTRRRNPRAA